MNLIDPNIIMQKLIVVELGLGAYIEEDLVGKQLGHENSSRIVGEPHRPKHKYAEINRRVF